MVALIIAVITAAAAVAQDAPRMDDKKHRELMPMHAKMMELQKAQDAEIDKLLAAMNSAKAEQRIDAAIAVINKLVEQRKAMHAQIGARLDH